MDVITHSVIAETVYRRCPDQLQAFLRLSDLELHYWSHLPDQVDQDNITPTGNCLLEEAWAHSYKLHWDRDKDLVTPVGGSAVEVLTATPRLARNAAKEGRFDEVREHLARSIHVSTDLATIWHLTRDLPKEYHKDGEAELARVARKVLHPALELEPLKLPQPKSLYESLAILAEETLRTQFDRVKAAQAAGGIVKTREWALAKEMLTRCAGQSLAVLLYAWRYVQATWK